MKLSIKLLVCLACVSQTMYAETTSQNSNPNISEFCSKNFKLSPTDREVMKYANNPYGWSALNYAIHEQDYEAAIVIASNCKDMTVLNKKDSLYPSNKSNVLYNALNRLLHIAHFVNKQVELDFLQITLANILIDKGIACNEKDCSYVPIIYCCILGELDITKKLLDRGADVNYNNSSPLSLAILNGHVDLAKYLITRKVNTVQADMLRNAILSKNTELVELALQCGYDITKIDVIGIAIDFTWDEIRQLDEDLFDNLPAFDMVSYLLASGGNPNFWIFKDSQDLKKGYRNSPMGKAEHLIDGIPYGYQRWYQQALINLLLEYGAVQL